ncbi:hypothetical protein ACFLQ2_05195 [archaeon]
MKKLLLVLMVILAVGCVEDAPENGAQPIGGETDEHGCLGPAGYTWNTEIGACAREWEVAEGHRAAAKAAATYLGNKDGLTLTRVDAMQCPDCYTIHFSLEGGLSEVKVAGGSVVQDFPTATPVVTPTPTPTPTPEPEYTGPMYTYLNLVEARCDEGSIIMKVWNTGGYPTGEPLSRVYEVDEDKNVLKTCLEFTLPGVGKNSKVEFTLYDLKYGVEECDYTSGNYMLTAIEADESGILFSNMTVKC